MLKTAGLSTKVINLRPYKDPDEFIKNMGKEAFQERLDHGMNSFMFELKALEGQYDMEDPQGRTDFFKETAKRLLRFEDEIERSSYIKTIAGTYQVEPEELRKMVNRLAMKGVGMTETVKPKSGLNRNKEKQNGTGEGAGITGCDMQNEGRQYRPPHRESGTYRHAGADESDAGEKRTGRVKSRKAAFAYFFLLRIKYKQYMEGWKNRWKWIKPNLQNS